eukprot:Sspe_Gene.56377::Locus_31021_Transcript_1_1_Confidence_1.000_Length_2502::g.56377::m.56377
MPVPDGTWGEVTWGTPMDWTVDEVSDWLRDQGLEHLVAVFAANDIDGAALLSMTPREIKEELAVPRLVDRRELSKGIRELQHVHLAREPEGEAKEGAMRSTRSEATPNAVGGCTTTCSSGKGGTCTPSREAIVQLEKELQEVREQRVQHLAELEELRAAALRPPRHPKVGAAGVAHYTSNQTSGSPARVVSEASSDRQHIGNMIRPSMAEEEKPRAFPATPGGSAFQAPHHTPLALDAMGKAFDDALAALLADRTSSVPPLSALVLHERLGAFVEAVALNTSLTSLDLTSKHLGDASARVLARGIRQHGRLLDIRLGQNRLSVDGLAAVAAAVSGTPVKAIDLHCNLFRDDCAEALGALVTGAPSLGRLDLTGNPGVGDASGKGILKALQDHAVPLEVLLTHSGVSPALQAEVRAAAWTGGRKPTPTERATPQPAEEIDESTPWCDRAARSSPWGCAVCGGPHLHRNCPRRLVESAGTRLFNREHVESYESLTMLRSSVGMRALQYEAV